MSNTFVVIQVHIFSRSSKTLAEPQRKPIDNFYDGDEADAKAEAADPTKVGDEVKPGHLHTPLKL